MKKKIEKALKELNDAAVKVANAKKNFDISDEKYNSKVQKCIDLLEILNNK